MRVWQTFSTDHALADQFLRPELETFAGGFTCGPDIRVLASYVGKLGNPADGGLPEEFRHARNYIARQSARRLNLVQQLADSDQPVLSMRRQSGGDFGF